MDLDFLLGKDQSELSALQMTLRAVIIYLSAILMVRLGNKRFLGRTTAFDFLLGIIIGSVLSRGINGGAPFFPTIIAAASLVMIHYLFGLIAFKWSKFGTMIKGRSRTLVKEGNINWDIMKKAHITEEDLVTEMRQNSSIEKIADIKLACLERSGEISFIKK